MDATLSDLCFGRFQLDANRRELSVDGVAVKLGARAFDVLLALVERRDRVVSKNELLDLAWPGVVVEENNLQVQISTLRKLLGPQAIATIPGRGYRFSLALDGAPQPSFTSTRPETRIASGTRESPKSRPDELPPLYGRDVEVQEVVQLLKQHHLVSIVGPGGIGKTRLGQAVAHELRDRFDDGVWLIELAALSDPARVVTTVAHTLKMSVSDEVVALDAVVDAVRGKRVLLVLDNCEHLVGAVSTLAAATRRDAPSVTLLATSQETLKVADEHVYRLGTLLVPEIDALPEVNVALKYGAVALFVARAQAADPRFTLNARNVDAILEICRRLDGIALALEIAAARVSLLGVEGLRARLNERFNIVAGGNRTALQRHQTLRAALEWSHALLTDAEQTVFRRLSVFVGGFPLELAQDVAGDQTMDKWQVLDHLAALVDKSLVVVDTGDPPRYRLLETSRLYAIERLVAAGEQESVTRRHAHAFAALFETALADRWSARSTDAVACLEPELDNLRAALDWSSRNDSELEIALVGAAAWVWSGCGLHAEGVTACERAISRLGTQTPAPLEARVLSDLAQLGWYVLPLDRALQALERAIALYRDSNDRVGLYLALARKAGFLASGGDAQLARRALVDLENLETETWLPRLRQERLIAKIRVILFVGPLEEFQAAHEERYHLACAGGNERDRLLARGNLASWKVGVGQLEEAIREGLDLVDEFRRHGIAGTFLGYLLAHVAMALVLRGRLSEALPVLRDAAPALRAGAIVWRLLDLFALIALLSGRKDNAARLFGAGAEIFKKLGRRREIVLDRLHDIVSEQLRGALSPETLARLLREGSAMSEREAVVAALHELASA